VAEIGAAREVAVEGNTPSSESARTTTTHVTVRDLFREEVIDSSLHRYIESAGEHETLPDGAPPDAKHGANLVGAESRDGKEVEDFSISRLDLLEGGTHAHTEIDGHRGGRFPFNVLPTAACL